MNILQLLLRTSCLLLASCAAPPFSKPQPVADWTDPYKQGRAYIAGAECKRVFESPHRPGYWAVDFDACVVANSPALVEKLRSAISDRRAPEFPEFSTLHEAGGKKLRLVPSPIPWVWPWEFRPFITYVTYPPPTRRSDGDWEGVVWCRLYVAQKPVGEVVLAIDAEALRNLLIERADKTSPLFTVPAGGLTGEPFVLRVSEPDRDTPSSPATAGAVIIGGK